jgi:hypothetical protein
MHILRNLSVFLLFVVRYVIQKTFNKIISLSIKRESELQFGVMWVVSLHSHVHLQVGDRLIVRV